MPHRGAMVRRSSRIAARSSTRGLAGYAMQNRGTIARQAMQLAYRNRGAIARGVGTLFNRIKRKRTVEDVGTPKHDLEDQTGQSGAHKVTAIRFKKKGIRQKKVKRLKLSKRFKLGVEQVLEAKTSTGFVRESYFGGALSLNVSAANSQGILDGFMNNNNSSPSFWSFSPEYFLYCANVLWAGKAMTNLPASINPHPFLGSTITGTNTLLNPFNVRFTVISCFTLYTMKNTSQRSVKLKIWLCAPKRISSCQFGAVGANSILNIPVITGNLTSSATTTVPDALGTPNYFWTNSVSDEKLMEVALGYPQGTNTYNASPTNFREWNKAYKAELTEVIIEPGQSYTYRFNGPSELDVDFSKMYAEGVFMNVQRWMRYPIVGTIMDLVNSVTGAAANNTGRYSEPNSLGVLAIERQDFTKIRIPDQAGLKLNNATLASGTELTLNQRHHSHAVSIYTAGSIGSNLEYTNAENPATIISA